MKQAISNLIFIFDKSENKWIVSITYSMKANKKREELMEKKVEWLRNWIKEVNEELNKI